MKPRNLLSSNSYIFLSFLVEENFSYQWYSQATAFSSDHNTVSTLWYLNYNPPEVGPRLVTNILPRSKKETKWLGQSRTNTRARGTWTTPGISIRLILQRKGSLRPSLHCPNVDDDFSEFRARATLEPVSLLRTWSWIYRCSFRAATRKEPTITVKLTTEKFFHNQSGR